MDTIILPITDFVRNHKKYTDLLATVDELVLTRDGRPFATIQATPEVKNAKLLSIAGAWKGTDLDDDDFWKKVRVRKNKPNLGEPL